MNEAQTRLELIDPAIQAAGWTKANNCPAAGLRSPSPRGIELKFVKASVSEAPSAKVRG